MKKIYIVLSVLIVAFYSCTDNSTFNNPSHHELEKGAFASFAPGSAIPPVFFDPQNISITAEILDDNNNIAEYVLLLQANISGVPYFSETFSPITSFPGTLNITSQNIADAIGLSVNDLGFGDSFNFTAKVTRNDGTVFYGIAPTFDEDNGTVGIGNTEPTLNVPTYESAMGFVVALACPPSPAGVYRIEMHDSFGDGWQTDDGNGGSGIQIAIDDDVIEVGMCSPYGGSNAGTFAGGPDCTGPASTSFYDATAFVTIPDGADVILWTFPGDAYGEISFEIYDPNDVLIGQYGLGHPAGLLILCDNQLGS